MSEFLNDFESLFGQDPNPKKKRTWKKKLNRDWRKEEESIKANPNNKSSITIRLDRDILEFFKKDGDGYQTRINDALRQYVEYHDRSKRK